MDIYAEMDIQCMQLEHSVHFFSQKRGLPSL